MQLSARTQPAPSRSTGFTLAEVAVTIAIVGFMLTMLAQGLHGAKFQAAYTRNYKVARELAVVTLGELASGVYSNELEGDDRLEGTYADEGYPDFYYELLIGDEQFDDYDASEDRTSLPYDTVRARQDREEEARRENDDDDEDEEVEEFYETVRIRVFFPAIKDYPNELVLEQWVEWALIHGESEEEATGGASGSISPTPGGGR